MIELEHIHFQNGGVSLHAVAAGPADGPVAVLLHGFPEFWYGWRHQIEPLAEAGFRVIVPDGRGYNESGKPPGIASYALGQLTSDVIAIADQLGRERILLAGHDWGAAVAWTVAQQFPERVQRMVILNVPPPQIMSRFVRRNPRQLLRSWYILFFQLPWLPELLFSACGFRVGIKSLVRSSRKGTFSTQDLAGYRSAWSRPGCVKGMINWYRALLRYPMPPGILPVSAPTLILWGRQDRFLVPQLAERSLAVCRNGKLVWLDEASHWIQHEEACLVSHHLVRWFREKEGGAANITSNLRDVVTRPSPVQVLG